MTTEYNATVELDTRDPVDERLLAALTEYHPATGRGPRGHVQVIITLPATSLAQAASTALAVVGAAGVAPALSIEVLPTAEYDQRNGLQPLPELLSVSMAARRAGVSRQAILQRIESGSLTGSRIGTAWVLQADQVDAAFARDAG